MTSPPVTTDARRAAETLSRGGIVAIPTETVYGLAGRVHDEAAVRRIFAVKARPLSHPLIVHLAAGDDPSRWGHINDSARRLAEAFWPGPLTLLVPRTPLVPDWVTGGRDSVALRVPSHPATQELLDCLDDALVAPSANRFGHVSPTRADHVVHDLGDRVDLVLDGGPCTVGIESTIVECNDRACSVLRPGAITSDHVAQVLSSPLRGDDGDSRAPGMMKSHYAPNAVVLLSDTVAGARRTAEELRNAGRSAEVLWYQDPGEYAARLYERLRDADARGLEIVVAVLPEDEGIGRAIRDRLAKASAERDWP